jgi:hypothetical protein
VGNRIKDEPDGRRRCRICGTIYERSPEFFQRSKDCIDGISGTCRSCYRQQQKRSNDKHRERIAAERRRKYAETEGLIAKAEEQRRWERQPLLERAKVLRSGMQVRARKWKLPFDESTLTVARLVEELRHNPKCRCCGVPLRIERARRTEVGDGVTKGR